MRWLHCPSVRCNSVCCIDVCCIDVCRNNVRCTESWRCPCLSVEVGLLAVVLDPVYAGDLEASSALHQDRATRFAQLHSKVLPTTHDTGVQPQVFQGLALRLFVLACGPLQHAGGERANKKHKVLAQRGVVNRLGQTVQTPAPTGRRELSRDQGLQTLGGAQYMQTVGRQYP